MKLIIPGQPIAKQRARTLHRGNKTWSYNPQYKEELKYKLALKREIDENGLHFELDDFIHLNILFYVSPPISSPTRFKMHCMWNLEHPTKFDCDNAIKWVCDASNEILYNDDRQIISISATKQYSNTPRTEIDIMTIHKFNLDENSLKVLSHFDPNKLSEFISDAQKIAQLNPQDINQLQGINKENFLSFSSSLITDFAMRYGDELKKIKSHNDKSIKNRIGKPIC